MNQGERHDSALQIAVNRQCESLPAGGSVPAARLLAEFTRAGQQRLTFLRGLYRAGRLRDHPGEAGERRE